jgi:PAS domain S-box-containing protein
VHARVITLLNGNFPTVPASSLTLAHIPLTGEHDLVSLRRRTRAAALDFGLSERRQRGLSAAAYEAATLVYRAGLDAAATVNLADGTLQVVVRASGAAPAIDGFRATLHAALERLRVLVDRLTIDDAEGAITVMLTTTVAATRQAAPNPEAAEARAEPDEATSEQVALLRAMRDLRGELDETNRGVVALFAELEDQAARLRQAEDRFRVLLDSVQDYAICMLDADGQVISWNAGAQRLFGYSADEITGRSFAGFYTPSDREAGQPANDLAAARDDGRIETEGLRVRQGGSAFDAHVLLTPVRGQDGAERGYALVVRDVTERRRLEDSLRRRAEDLAAANRAKEEFLATLSHELRTPLNAMLGWTRLLRMGKLDRAAQSRALETIERNAHVQEQLIADILDVSRIVTGKLRVDLRPIDLTPIVDAAVDSVQPAADAKGISLSLEVQPVGSIMGDPDRLQQVLWNLLSNAIKFTPSGGRVTLSVERSGSHVLVAVADSGEGMPPDLVPFVFDRFTQGDGSVTRHHGGLGLGLSIVRHIVELHGGHVHASSEGQDRGSRFSVYLPLRAVREQAAGQEPAATLAGVKVLVVDDEADAREVVSLALAQLGASTLAAGSADEALRILPNFRPDVLVSDIRMPGEDGYALIRRVRALGEPGLGDIPAVALTGFSQPTEKRRALMAGFHTFVVKPVETEELAAVVRTLAPRRS